MEKQRNIPKLRFPEFKDKWERKKLGDFYNNLRTGMTPSRARPEYFTGDVLWITSGELNYGYISDTKEKITEEAIKNTHLEVYPANTLFIAITGLEAAGTRGKCAINKIPATTNQSCMAFDKRENIDNLFLFFWYHRYGISLYYKYAQGTKQQSFNNALVEKFEFALPSLTEQNRIAAFFTVLDKKIAELKSRQNLLEQYKKGILQKIFSQELRFQDNDGENFPDWEFRYGGEMFTSISNKTHNSDLPLLAISQEFGAVPRNLIKYQISVTEKSIEGYKVVQVGDFIISLRSFQGGIEYSNYDGICSPAYIILRSEVEINNSFYKFYFKTHKYIQ